jgi:hypothetical protein
MAQELPPRGTVANLTALFEPKRTTARPQTEGNASGLHVARDSCSADSHTHTRAHTNTAHPSKSLAPLPPPLAHAHMRCSLVSASAAGAPGSRAPMLSPDAAAAGHAAPGAYPLLRVPHRLACRSYASLVSASAAGAPGSRAPILSPAAAAVAAG